jgi:hypothetical protein
MGIFDRVRESAADDREGTPPPEESETKSPEPMERSRQVSDGGSGFDNVESAAGGADAVPDTPDGVEEDYT